MKKGDLVNLNRPILCNRCNKPLHFMYESAHGDRLIAHCCDMQYNIRPSSIYEVELIAGIGVSGANCDDAEDSIPTLQDLYGVWRAEGIKAAEGGMISFTWDCEEISARQDFEAFLEAELGCFIPITFEKMQELENNYKKIL